MPTKKKKTDKKDTKKKKAEKKKPGTALMPREEAETLTKKKNAQKRILLIKRQFMPRGATEDELAMFLTVCKRKALDPFLGHISCSRIDGKLVFMTSIDALRLIAQRTKCYAPSPKPSHYEYKKDGKLLSCRVWVLKYVNEQSVEYDGLAFYDEQVGRKGDGTLKKIWQRMPRHMLAIRAESFALRRGFPAELSGLYTKEEIEDSVMKEITPEAISEASGGGVQRAKAALKAPDPEAPDPEAQKPEAPEEAGEPVLDAEYEDVEGNGETTTQEAAPNSGLFVPTCEKCKGPIADAGSGVGKCLNENCKKFHIKVKL